MKTHIKLLGYTILCLILISCEKDKRNQIVPIKDSNFEKALVAKKLDKKLDGLMELTKEIVECTELNISGLGIQSLEEIKYFSKLKTLYCNGNKLESLDLRSNESLRFLNCSSNKLKSLDLRSNESLNVLYCFSNELESLYLRFNKSLKKLNCGSNKLKSLDPRFNDSLETLICHSNELQSLDLRWNKSLEKLNCENNKLKRISIYQNPKLTSIYFDESVENAEQVEKIITGNNQASVISNNLRANSTSDTWLSLIGITLIVLVIGKIIKHISKS